MKKAIEKESQSEDIEEDSMSQNESNSEHCKSL